MEDSKWFVDARNTTRAVEYEKDCTTLGRGVR